MAHTYRDLPAELEDRLADVLFRSAPPDARQIRELCANHPRWADGIIVRAAQLGIDIPGLESEDAGRIGSYRLLRRIGEGGCGVVYAAVVDGPEPELLAVKVLKPEAANGDLARLFLQEGRVLSAMRHPFIVTVHACGTDAGGDAFIVMDLVHGVPMTEFCRGNALGLEARIRLFQRVCQGVQHAHSKTVVHRDLKPSNILVEWDDDGPVPRILDFGMASALDPTLAGSGSGVPERGGTPEYMAPEQLTPHRVLEPGRFIDTRADVYSLGIVLFEILTGEPPFQRCAGEASDAFADRIQALAPQRPGERVRALSAGLGKDPSPGEFRALPEDLDWIVLRAMERDPGQRYQSPMDLARDLDRWLDHRPVEARPPSKGYVFSRFLRRHRLPVVAATLMVLGLAAGVTLASIGMLRARRSAEVAAKERDLADRVVQFHLEKLWQVDPARAGLSMRHLLIDRVQEASSVRRTADGEGEREGTPDADTFADLIDGTDFTSLAVSVLEENLIDPALADVEARFADDPLLRAELLQGLATIWGKLGRTEQATRVQRVAMGLRIRALGEAHPKTLSAVELLACLLYEEGRYSEALELQRPLLERRRQDLGPDHDATLRAMSAVALTLKSLGRLKTARDMEEQVLETRQSVGSGDLEILGAMANLADTLRELGEPRRARAMQDEVLARARGTLGVDHALTLRTMQSLVATLDDLGDYARALDMAATLVECRKRSLGEEHPATLSSMNSLAIQYRRMGDHQAARDLHASVLDARIRLLGWKHSATLTSANNLAKALVAAGDPDHAGDLQREVLARRRGLLGPDHRDTLAASNNLAMTLVLQGELAEASALAEDVRSRAKEGSEEELLASGTLAVILSRQGSHDRAVPIQRRIVDYRRKELGTGHRQTLVAMNDLASSHLGAGMLQDALKILEEAAEVGRTALGPEDPDVLAVIGNLGECLHRLGRHAEAEKYLTHVVDSGRKALGADHAHVLRGLDQLAMTHEAMGRKDRARAFAEEALAIRRRRHGDDTRETWAAMNRLSYVLSSMGDLKALLAVQEDLLAAKVRVLGGGASSTVVSKHNVARTLGDLGEHGRARALAAEALPEAIALWGPSDERTKAIEALTRRDE